MRASQQHGMMLIEALISILIFALGILGMIAMGSAAVTSQSDSRFRTEAAGMAEAIASEISLNVNRTSDATIAASLAPYQHQPASGGDCAFSGGETTVVPVRDLAHKAGNEPTGVVGLPGASTANQQILVETAGQYNRVTITLCWKTASDAVMRKHTLVSYIN